MNNLTTKKALVKGMACPLMIRARKVLQERKDISLVITGGLHVSSDFAKAFAMGADAVGDWNCSAHSPRLPAISGLQHGQVPGGNRDAGPGSAVTLQCG